MPWAFLLALSRKCLEIAKGRRQEVVRWIDPLGVERCVVQAQMQREAAQAASSSPDDLSYSTCAATALAPRRLNRSRCSSAR